MSGSVAWTCAATAFACAAAVAGCGLGPGASSAGTARLTITRDYGSATLLEASDEDPPASETVIRFLDDEADIATRYGGGFVQSINGLAGTGSSDWFFYVNGVESPVGAAEMQVKGGDRIWWDYREWDAAMSVPAVVGSWPEPFAQASSERPRPVAVECRNVRRACRVVRARLAAAGVDARMTNAKPPGDALRLLVGAWTQVRSDPSVDELRGAPATNGVFATFERHAGGEQLVGLDASGHAARDLGPGAGLIAALGRPPTWIVTGSRRDAVIRAAKLLRERFLRNHYAIAALAGRSVPLPIAGGGSA